MDARRIIQGLLAGAVLFCIGPRSARAVADGFLLIDRDLKSQRIRLLEIDDHDVVYGDVDDQPQRFPLRRCIALLAVDAPVDLLPDGMLRLVDGQALPGRIMLDAPMSEGRMEWGHRLLGVMDIDLQDVATIQVDASKPAPVARDADVLALANGDRLEGFLIGLDDVVSIEVEMDGAVRTVDVPLNDVQSVSMVTAHRYVESSRLWLRDGTVLDVETVRVGEDGLMRLVEPRIIGSATGKPRSLDHLVAAVFDPGAFVPLAALPPTSVEGPNTRYFLPEPRRTTDEAPAGLAALSIRGPIRVHYTLPDEARRFACEAMLPPEARRYGDCELIIRDSGQERFRAHLSPASPVAIVNIELAGPDLVIELTSGTNGAIQNHVLLQRAMIGIDGPPNRDGE